MIPESLYNSIIESIDIIKYQDIIINSYLTSCTTYLNEFTSQVGTSTPNTLIKEIDNIKITIEDDHPSNSSDARGINPLLTALNRLEPNPGPGPGPIPPSPEWLFNKGIYQGADVPSPNTDAEFVIEFTSMANTFHSMGIDVIHANQLSMCKLMLTTSIASCLRSNGQKILVSVLDSMGGPLKADIDDTVDEIIFISAGKWQFDYFNTYYYDTFWLDDECIKYTSYVTSGSTISWKGCNVYVTTFSGCTRGQSGTTPSPHYEGSIALNSEFLETNMAIVADPANLDLIWGYYCQDDQPVFPDCVVSNYGLSKNYSRIIRSYDPDTSHLLCYGQMPQDPDANVCLHGTRNFEYIDAIMPYIFPWRNDGGHFDLWATRYTQDLNYFANVGKSPIIFPIVQAAGWSFYFPLPTKDQINTELAFHIANGANGIFFYNGEHANSNMWSNVDVYDAIEEFNFPLD